MKCIKLTYRGKNGKPATRIERVTDEYANARVGNLSYTAKAEYVSKSEWKEGGRK